MSEVIEMPINSTPTSKSFLTGQKILELQAKNRAHFEKIAPRIREQYGVTTDWEVREIERAEQELEQCQSCTGEPCRKSQNQYFKPVIRVDEHRSLSIANAYCYFGEQRVLRRKCKHAQIPQMYIGKTFRDYEVTEDNEFAVKLAQIFCSNKPNAGLYLHGECGTGKTFLAAIIAQDFMLDFKTVVFGDVPYLMEAIKRSFDGDTPNPLDHYCDSDLLVLDDIGAGYLTDWNVGQLYQIINARYSLNKPIIATSNYDLDELEFELSKFGQVTAKRITSRLSEMCTAAFLGTNDRRR